MNTSRAAADPAEALRVRCGRNPRFRAGSSGSGLYRSSTRPRAPVGGRGGAMGGVLAPSARLPWPRRVLERLRNGAKASARRSIAAGRWARRPHDCGKGSLISVRPQECRPWNRATSSGHLIQRSRFRIADRRRWPARGHSDHSRLAQERRRKRPLKGVSPSQSAWPSRSSRSIPPISCLVSACQRHRLAPLARALCRGERPDSPDGGDCG